LTRPPVASTHQQDFQLAGFDGTRNLKSEPAGLPTQQKNRPQLVYGSGKSYEKAFNGNQRRLCLMLPLGECFKSNGTQMFRDDTIGQSRTRTQDQELIRRPVNARLTVPIAHVGALPSF
jgi:hypothetical protein